MGKIVVLDTTLRDGTQGEGISLSVEDKLKITVKLDALGIPYIEGGWPGSNPKDIEYFQRVQKLSLQQAKITAFSSTRRPGISVEEDSNIQELLKAGTPAVTLFGKSWDLHVVQALNTTLEENLAMIKDTVSFFKAAGREVIYDAEHFFDGYKSNSQYALTTIRAAADAGADWVVLCDTNGGMLPSEIGEIVTVAGENVSVPLGIHAHNDGDLAVANSLQAVASGAQMVQGTINGLGERCGNANLCSIIPNLELKMGDSCLPENNLSLLTETAHYVSELANLAQQSQQPFVGMSAFAHKGGIHVSAVTKNPATYEHMDPQLVGNKRRVLVSELSGVSNLKYKAQELNIELPLETPESREIIKRIKELEHKGFQYEGAEASLELLLRKALNQYQDYFQLESLKVIMEKRENMGITSEAMIKLKVGTETVHTAAEGNGPVNALDNALRKALEEFYPDIKNIHLSDYKVRVLDEKDATGATVRVLIETMDQESSWNTVGVHENIIEASWQALTDGITYALYKKDHQQSTQ
ncbi:citramalate synthase [Dehalobacterium formicoaceticum]|uniref:Citramalate synthase n=1 Tax=Dehalobacterium formicoaceticum TaxID=51515 RepID=A0ABT1Y0H2_9FIRM|nr:citramalate synthase [Dehalobacterium formicoaceticum]MCR6544367.1 citramalate synthase [Dehalobacterium formicoaceticum]